MDGRTDQTIDCITDSIWIVTFLFTTFRAWARIWESVLILLLAILVERINKLLIYRRWVTQFLFKLLPMGLCRCFAFNPKRNCVHPPP